MKKKLLFVIDSLHSGGAEKSLISLLSILDYTRFDVDILLFNKEGLYLPLVPEQVRILEVPEYFRYKLKDKNKINLKMELARLRNSLYIRNPYYKKKYHGAQITCKNILKNLSKQPIKYDVAIAYSQGLPTYYVSEKVNAKKKLCWVNIDYKFAGYNRKFDFKYYEKFNNIVAVSNACTDVLKNVFPEFENKIVTIYDIISENLINNMASEGKGYTDDYKGIRILTIGRLVYQKGYEYAIEAAKYLKENNIDFRWYVIGEGNLKEELRKMVNEYNLEDEFKFLGTFTNPYPFIKECDIYCQPSRFEGFGLAIAEARILNKPIVATNFDIVYDQIRDGENGVIAEMNGENLGKKIQLLIEDENLVNSIITNLKMEKVGTEKEIQKVYSLL